MRKLKRVSEYQKNMRNESLSTNTSDLLNSNIEIILDLAKGNLISNYYDGKGNFQDNLLHLKRLLSMMAHPDKVRSGMFEYELEATGCKDVNELLDKLLNCILDYKESHIDVAIQTLKDIQRDLNTL